jgi:hypothetical protein
MANVSRETIDLEGVSPTDLEEHVHPFGAGTFAAKTVVEPIPAAFLSRKKMDYSVRTDGQPVYVGFNNRGSLTSDSNWVIQKLTYNTNGFVTDVDIAIDSWDNRTGATYA